MPWWCHPEAGGLKSLLVGGDNVGRKNKPAPNRGATEALLDFRRPSSNGLLLARLQVFDKYHRRGLAVGVRTTAVGYRYC